MIWLDGLDLPVYKFLRNNFAENYSEPRYPSQPVQDSSFKFAWEPVAEKLNSVQATYAMHQYRLPNGEHLSKTISAQAERIGAGTSSPKSRETCSFVYHIYQGTGYTILELADGSNTKIEWTEKDTFTVPSWSAVTHSCTNKSGDAYTFAINDRPMVESLGTARKA